MWKRMNMIMPKLVHRKYKQLPELQLSISSDMILIQSFYHEKTKLYAQKHGIGYCVSKEKYKSINTALQTARYVFYVGDNYVTDSSKDIRRIVQQAGDVDLILSDKKKPCTDILIFRKSEFSTYKLQQLYWDGDCKILDQIYTTYTPPIYDSNTPIFLCGITIYDKGVFNFFRGKKCSVYPWVDIAGFEEIPRHIPYLEPVYGCIPKYIFQTMETTLLPKDMASAMGKWKTMNPEYKHIYFDGLQCRQFIALHFPNVLNSYDKLLPGAFKADLWRYCILYKYGGVYADSRTVPLLRLKNIINSSDRFIVPRDPINTFLWQGFMCSVPGHPVLKAIITSICNMCKANTYGDCPLDITGPMRLGRIVNRYLYRYEHSSFKIETVRNVKIVDIKNLKGNHIMVNGRKAIRTKYIVDDKLFLQLSGKEKYNESWFKGRLYKCINEE